MKSAYIVSSVRTAVGKAERGTLRHFRPDDMGAIVLKAAIERVKGLEPEQIDDVIMGCAVPEAEQGLNLGKIIAQRAGLPYSVSGCTVNRFCASGLQSIAMATQAILAGHAEIVVGGGIESMSIVKPWETYMAPNPELITHSPNAYAMAGITAENVAQKYHISRQDQDEFALRSHQRALTAIQTGRFQEEIIPLTIKEKHYVNGKVQTIEKVFQIDEGPRPNTSIEALAKLQPAFRVGGTITAGNSSQKSDGAAAAVIMSEAMVKKRNIQPLGQLLGFAMAGVPPEIMGIGPVAAVPKVLKQVGLTLADIGLIELNEAFAAQALAVIRELSMNEEIVNVNGGAIALGHPLGCTGAKLMATLLYEMKRRKVRYGLCTMCIGGGMGVAGVFENLML